MVLLMLFTMSSVDVCAQSFLKKIGKAVEKEVKNKVEKEIDVEGELLALINDGVSKKEAVKIISSKYDLPKNEVYALAVKL